MRSELRQWFWTWLGIAVLVLLRATVAVASETKSNEPPTYRVVRATAAPIVDGRLDDPVWQKIKVEPLGWEVDLVMPWADESDVRGSFRAVWREGRVYFAVSLEDDRVETDNRKAELSDRLELYMMRSYAPSPRRYTVPVRATGSMEDPNVPFAVWSPDGKVCEFSLETSAMYDRVPELQFNLYYVDVDNRRQDHRIGWVPQAGGSRNPQLGTLLFDSRVGSSGKLETTWGKVKTLY